MAAQDCNLKAANITEETSLVLPFWILFNIGFFFKIPLRTHKKVSI